MNDSYWKDLLIEVTKIILADFMHPSLRAVTVGWEEDWAYLRFIFSEKVSNDVKEDMSVMAGEIISQFPDGFYFHEEIITVDKSKPLEEYKLKEWVFKREDI